MATDDLNPADFTDILAALAGDPVDLPCSLDPADLNLPGGWLTLDTIETVALGGAAGLGCRLFIIAPNVQPSQALTILAPLLNGVKARVRESAGMSLNGAATTEAVVIPGVESAQLPAIAVPILVHTTQPE